MSRAPLLIPRLDAVPPRPPFRERLQQSFTSLGYFLAGLFHLAVVGICSWLAGALLANVSFLRPLLETGSALLRELTETLFR